MKENGIGQMGGQVILGAALNEAVAATDGAVSFGWEIYQMLNE